MSNAEKILALLTKLRDSFPFELTEMPPEWEGKTAGDPNDDFELDAVRAGLEQVATELALSLAHIRAQAVADALKVYYVTEELAKDPVNAHLIPHVEAMRRAYENDYGVPIPPRA